MNANSDLGTSTFDGVSVDRRHILLGFLSVVGIAGLANLTVASKRLAEAAQAMNYTPENLFDKITPLQHEARRLMGIAEYAHGSRYDDFTKEEEIALAFYAGCDFELVFEGAGEVFRPKHPIQVTRRLDGVIEVYEDGVLLDS